jgi:hypothetical protein
MHSSYRGAVLFNSQGIAKAVFGDWIVNYCILLVWRVILVVISMFGGILEMLITISVKVYRGIAKTHLAGIAAQYHCF